MTAIADRPTATLYGDQRPRIQTAPGDERSLSDGPLAVELAAAAGLYLDPWQAHCLDVALRKRTDGKWLAHEVGLVVPRQNGKNAVLEALELAALFLLGDRLVLHSAHEFRSANEAFLRIVDLVTSTHELNAQVKQVTRAHGNEGIELKDGARLRFLARTQGAGRGFSADRVVLDEAFSLSADSMAAILPTLTARPNAQVWYTSSAGMPASEQLARVRERGRVGSPSLAYLEWSAADGVSLDDRDAWAQANPALGYRITLDTIAQQREALSDDTFGRERLGLWAEVRSDVVIDPDVWAGLGDRASQVLDPVTLGVDVTPDRRHASIGVAGARYDGLLHVETIDNRRGTAWVVDRLVEVSGRLTTPPRAIVVDALSAAASLVPAIEAAGLRVEVTNARDLANGCGLFYDAVQQQRLRHVDAPLLNSTVGQARKRPLGDAWAWQRRDPSTDLTPLVAVTLALWGHHNIDDPKPKRTGKVW